MSILELLPAVLTSAILAYLAWMFAQADVEIFA